jgi:hypothetical protein
MLALCPPPPPPHTCRYYEPKAYEHYGYGDSKLTVKLWEKSRSTARLQSDANPNTYMFT